MNENIKEIVNIIGNAELSNKCHKECFINTDFDNECTLCRQATALYKAGYRKRTMMDRDKLAKLIDEFLTINEDGYYCEQFADYLIANGIGDITAEKHRADVAEEALDLAYEEWTCCDLCMFSIDCKTNRTDCKKAQISKIKQQAEARLKEDSK